MAKPLSISDRDLGKFDVNTYPLGLRTNFGRRKFPLPKSFAKTVSVSTDMKNENGHSGLLLLGWGGAGKTILADTIARKARLDNHQVIRFYQHDGEQKLGEGTHKFTDAKEFTAALIELSHSDFILPTVVIVDSVEAYVIDEENESPLPLPSVEKLSHLITVKTQLEQRFADKVLFVFAFKDDYSSEILPLLRSHVAMTVTGRINAHYAISKLWDKNSSTNIFYLVNELKPGEFVILDKEPSAFQAFSLVDLIRQSYR